MTKVQQNFEMWSGDNKDVIYTVTNGTGASKDLTGTSVVWVLSEDPSSGSLVKRSTDSGSGITIAGCTFTVSLSPTDTSSLAGLYYHESQVRDGTSDISTVAVGHVKINRDLAV